MKYFGYSPLVALSMSETTSFAVLNSPLRSPFNPSLFPATDRSWHGLPAHMMSTCGILSPFIFLMSPNCMTFGKCFLVTSMQNGSISDDHTGTAPFRCAAIHHPPIPSNRLPTVISIYFPVLPIPPVLSPSVLSPSTL